MSDEFHTPVLHHEVLTYLQPVAGGIYVDGTLGGGGHAEAIMTSVSPNGRLIGFDRDADAIQFAQKRLAMWGNRVTYIHDNYSRLEHHLKELHIGHVDGVLLDLGVSSRQLDEETRGFSFQSNHRLDMRMDATEARSAWDIVNTYDERSLADIFWKYGEERQSRRIARRITDECAKSPVETTQKLAYIIESVTGARFLPKTLARVFQAIRIEVNRELEHLQTGLQSAINLLGKGGRLVVISYHSLEDRIVKEVFRTAARSSIPSGHKLVADTKVDPLLDILTPKPIEASSNEVSRNPRARSAKLRAAERRG